MITRRLFGLGLLAAPAIIRTPGLLMPVKTSKFLDWVTPSIVTPKLLSFEEILAAHKQIMRDVFGSEIDLTPASPTGALCEVQSRMMFDQQSAMFTLQS